MKVISKAFKFILVFMIICGLIYPVFITGASQLLFKDKANGSIIEVNGKNMVVYYLLKNSLEMSIYGDV